MDKNNVLELQNNQWNHTQDVEQDGYSEASSSSGDFFTRKARLSCSENCCREWFCTCAQDPCYRSNNIALDFWMALIFVLIASASALFNI